MKEAKKQTLWVGTEDLSGSKEFIDQARKEFFDVPMANELADEEQAGSMKSNRRDFLKYLGFSIGAAAVAASCDTPVRRAIPYVVKPDAIVPGVANYYATSIVKGGDYCPVLVKTREGRPIKIEGNRMSKVTKGGTSARAQASVLELYDSSRIQKPGKIGQQASVEPMSWDDIDNEISAKLKNVTNVRVLSHTNLSPTAQKAINAFGSNFTDFKHVQYDPISCSALLDANEYSFGMRVVPEYHFDKADMIVNFGADFLGTWISPVEYAADYIEKRKIKDFKNPEQSRMVAIESSMSLTGSNADNRIVIRPSEMGLAIFTFYNALMELRLGGRKIAMPADFKDTRVNKKLEALAEDVMEARKNGKNILVVSGSNNVAEQILVNHINHKLGSYGKTLDFKHHSFQRKGKDQDLLELMSDMDRGRVDALIVLGDANPAYDIPEANAFAQAMSKVGLRISTSTMPSETMAACEYACPSHHQLERWGDVLPKAGVYNLIQPTISPLFDTREEELSLLKWVASTDVDWTSEQPYYEYIRNNWKVEFTPELDERGMAFQSAWDQFLHDGEVVRDLPEPELEYTPLEIGMVEEGANKPTNESVEVNLYETVNIGAGQYANNPWLQEMPDPLHRVVWDNYITIPVSWDGKNNINGWNGLKTGEIVEAQVGGKSVAMPVVETFGIPEGIVGAALGYGRTICGRAGRNIGTNLFPMLSRDANGNLKYYASFALGNKIGKDDEFASVQYHHTFGVKDEDPETGEVINVDEQSILTLGAGYQGALTDRSVIFQANLPHLDEAIEELKHHREEAAHLNEQTIYKGFDDLYKEGHKWEMSVDLSSCIGCGACQIACIAENNVPIVGKREVSRHHEMTWLRIDRYFYGDLESPNVVYQPMMCQHCDNAPCENVCPVGATNHSSEGLNQMTYNRCIGTRYCANNCPYKVRRFNWLDYTTADLFGLNENYPVEEGGEQPFYADNYTRMVLNPDVTVRSRGVIEKCTFCVQRIQEAKLEARVEMRSLKDGDIKTACATACPTGAISFGDINNKESEVSEKQESPLNYYVLEETNVRSSVGYHMKVINKNEKINEA